MDSSHIFPHQETQEAFVSVAAPVPRSQANDSACKEQEDKKGNARRPKVQHEVVSLFGAPPVLDI